MLARTTVFLDPSTIPLLDRAAKHYGISRSEWVRRAISHALEHEVAGQVRRNRPEFRIIDGGKMGKMEMIHAPESSLPTTSTTE